MSLDVVMYHYVRNVEGSRLPHLNAFPLSRFEEQVRALAEAGALVHLDEALELIDGSIRRGSRRVLLTFDDALREHAHEVTAILQSYGATGVFFLTTSCVEDRRVLDVHKNHALMGHLGFEAYRRVILDALAEIAPSTPLDVDPDAVRRTYRWDGAEVGALKYLINYVLTAPVRAAVLDRAFVSVLGDERAFAADLYLSWDDARAMERAGMILGGHSHTHPVLSSLGPEDQRQEIGRCADLLRARVGERAIGAFAYPYGKRSTFDAHTIELLQEHGFHCAFATEAGPAPGSDRFAIRRIDPKDLAA